MGDPMKNLVDWLIERGGAIDTSAIGFVNLPDTGRSAVALRDIAEGHTIFTIPRSLLLSTRTSDLRSKLGETAWASLGTGWASLILCMMYEQSKGAHGTWSSYLEILPSKFTTPMFWNAEDLEELQGTSVIEKIGKVEGDEDFGSRLCPLRNNRRDIFPTELDSTVFTLENFHRLGSSILSRSFHVEEWGKPKDEHSTDSESESDGDEELEDTGDVSMVPIADMLNARFGHDNARLFYEELSVSMTTTKHIKKGEQIWNTYGDPPNSDLLRRYGHVDLIALSDGRLGNPADVVEIKGSLALEILPPIEDSQERIEWWLEQGGDDVFVIEASEPQILEGLVPYLKLLLLTSDEWAQLRLKNKTPKSKLDQASGDAAIHLLQRRLQQYHTSVEEDEAVVQLGPGIAQNKINAIVVRLGEKRILTETLSALLKEVQALKALNGVDAGHGANLTKKRSRVSDGSAPLKKSRR